MSKDEVDKSDQYQWLPPTDGEVIISGEAINAVASIDRIFPGSRAVWWRRPGERWQRV